jgi:hypothetical protein
VALRITRQTTTPIIERNHPMFPVDLDGLLPAVIGAKTERQLSVNNLKLNLTISRVGQDEYDLLVVDTITNKRLLQRSGLQGSVIQLNWKNFRECGFQEIP